jgi:hypothetical protein
MRFTPEILRTHAQLLVEKETKRDRSIIAAYLRGSLLYGSPLLGGAGDIDLVFIHNSPPIREREVRKLTPEIHFDIEHHDELLYQKPRNVRVDPWLGPTIYDAQPLYDPRHFLDYTQAGARSNFDFPENILARSKPLIESSRQFWMERQISSPGEILREFPAFLEALHNTLTAIALQTGTPLPTRRLAQEFPDRASALDAPGLAVAFNHLLGSVSVTKNLLQDWLTEWDLIIDRLGDKLSPPPILFDKKIYYQKAMESLLQSGRPQDMLWQLLVTWTEAVSLLPNDSESQLAWMKALTSLGFAGQDYQQRLAALDGFLELCEELVLGEEKPL